jgi:uncharacterized protein
MAVIDAVFAPAFRRGRITVYRFELRHRIPTTLCVRTSQLNLPMRRPTLPALGVKRPGGSFAVGPGGSPQAVAGGCQRSCRRDLHTSALVKLVFEETESAALARWLQERGDVPKLSAEVATIELVRTCRRHDEAAVPAARELLAGLDLIPLSGDLVESAALTGPAELRSLDAIHLASASAVAEGITAFVVYDVRLASAASELGLPVASPA